MPEIGEKWPPRFVSRPLGSYTIIICSRIWLSKRLDYMVGATIFFHPNQPVTVVVVVMIV